MRPTYTQEQIEERYQKLPDALKQALFNPDVAEKMFNIGKKYGLTIEKIGLAADEVGAVILGFTKPSNFTGYLVSALGVESGKAGEIATDINHEIFFPLREELKKTHDEDFGMDAMRPSFMAPPRMQTSPPATDVTPPPLIMSKPLPAAKSPTIAPSQTFAQKPSAFGSATPAPLSSSLTRPTPPYPPEKSRTASPALPPTPAAPKITVPLSSKPAEEETPSPPRIISPGLEKKQSISALFKKPSWIMPQMKTPEPEKKPVSSYSSPRPSPELEKKIASPITVNTPKPQETSKLATTPHIPSQDSEKNTSIPPPKMPSLPRYAPPTTPKPIDLRKPSPNATPSISPPKPSIPPETITIYDDDALAEPKAELSITPPSTKLSNLPVKETFTKKILKDENDPYREPIE